MSHRRGTTGRGAFLVRRNDGQVPDRLDRRERKKLAVRRALETAALRLFDERGFAETTIDQIADEADVSRSTFFRYFGSKEAVLFGGYEQSGELLARLILERPREESMLAAIENAFVDLVGHQSVTPDPVIADRRRRILDSNAALRAKSDALIHRWRYRIAETLARREEQDEPGPEHLLAAAVGITVAERVGEQFGTAARAEDLDLIIREQFGLLRTLVATGL